MICTIIFTICKFITVIQINLQIKKESFDSLSKLSLYLFSHGDWMFFLGKTLFLISKVCTLESLIISVRFIIKLCN